MIRIRPRSLPVVAALAVLAAACTNGANAGDANTRTPARAPTQAPPQPNENAFSDSACSLPHEVLLRQWRGYYPGRSGDIIMIADAPDYMGNGYPHSGPWPYLERVPLFLYGPGYVRAAGPIGRNVTMADWAPTQAALLGMDFHAPDGHTLTDALVPASQRRTPPKLIVTVVWDGAGINVLDQWPKAWPNLKSMIGRGTWYENATVGSAPTSTAQDHPMLSTGAFPDHHGITGNHLRIDGHVREPYEQGPNLLLLPTVGDLWDKNHGNLPKVGMVASSPWHLGMLGHGNYTKGGDDDIAALHQFGGPRWALPYPLGRFYAFPDYINSLPPLSSYAHYADAIDGRVDGKWRGHEMAKEGSGFNTPERIPYQTRALEEVLKREGFGADALSDLFYTNYKLTDEVGHIWTMNSVEEHDSLLATDHALPELITYLNDHVGKGQWVMALTADHGSQPNPTATGAFRGSTAALKGYIGRVFDHDDDNVKVLQSMQPTHMYINVQELHQNGFTLGQVAEYVARLTQSQLAASDSIIQPGHGDDRVFRSVFPSNVMRSLRCLPEARSSQ